MNYNIGAVNASRRFPLSHPERSRFSGGARDLAWSVTRGKTFLLNLDHARRRAGLDLAHAFHNFAREFVNRLGVRRVLAF